MRICGFCSPFVVLSKPLKTPVASPQARSLPLQPIPTADLLAFQLAAQVRRDPQFGGVPEPIHFTGEVFGELGRVNGEQGLVVGVGSRR